MEKDEAKQIKLDDSVLYRKKLAKVVSRIITEEYISIDVQLCESKRIFRNINIEKIFKICTICDGTQKALISYDGMLIPRICKACKGTGKEISP